ncbi:MAG: hypothetical protein IIX84_04995 [Oscillospiraceae bacterium]|nr:hypothetical protein [Oscillospiraceae bacterium]
MKKRYFLAALLLISAVLFSACGETEPEETTAATTSSTAATTTPTTYDQTGYPSGEVQNQTVFVDGILYYRTNGRKYTPPFNDSGYEFVGNTVAEDNVNFPDTHLEASRTPVGSAVYRKNGAVYILNEEHGSLGILSPAPFYMVPGGGFLPEINVVSIYIDGTLYQPIAADRLSDDEAFYIPLSVLETKEEYTFIGHTFPGDSYTLPDEQFEASMMPQQNSIFFDGEYYYYHDKQSSMLIRLIPAPADWIPGEYLAN